jgi:hypothetical protein
MILRYVLSILSYAALGGILLEVVKGAYPRPTAAIIFGVAWLFGFVWLSAYVSADWQSANYLVKLTAGMFAAYAALGAIVWLVLELS